ncbi:MAG: hypothetical protein K2K26_05475 [Muribaculaceae bacterium]|nr:hypothetical protein [Muribaculaceae bacterium]
MMVRRLLPYVLGGAILTGVIACNSDECYDNRNSLPLAGFYTATETPQAVSIDSVSIYAIGAPGDSILHDSVRSLAQTYLPLRIDGTSSTVNYVIRYLQGALGRFGIADTISISYDIEPQFVSAACGVIYIFRITDLTTTTYCIDSVTCPRGYIDNVAIENIHIYFRVNTDEDETV